MRRLTIMLGVMMLLVVVAAAAALAVTRTCNDIPCNGTPNEDRLYEREGTVSDAIYGFGAHDVIDANTFNFDRDRLYGGGRNDKLLTNDGDGRDVVRGGKGRDVCLVDPGDRTVNCEIRRDVRGPEGTATDADDVGMEAYQ